MKPLKLEFCGINSFSEPTVIDFEPLTKSGLFGIFGDTGSGKSTILDCINFALYGSVERSKGKTDIINYRSNAAEVKFVFDILADGRRKRYTVERTIKKDKNGTHKAKLFEDDGVQEVCIADKATEVERKIVDILGVEAEDFRKCIALPQGEFSQFVKSTPSERLALIERLFNLARYGNELKEKISFRQADADGRFQNLSGRMAGYEGVSEEALRSAERELSEAAAGQTALQKEREAAETERNALKSLSDKRAELNAVCAELQKLGERRAKMEELRRDLDALPSCREVAATAETLRKKRADVAKFAHDISGLNGESERERAACARLERELAETDFDGDVARLTKLCATYETCAGKPEKLKELTEKLAEKRGEYRKKDGECAALEKRRAEAEKAVREAEKALARNDDNDEERLVDVNLKGSILRDEYARTLGDYVSLRSDLRVYEDGSPLYGYVTGALDEKIAEYRQKLSDLKDVKGMDVDECAKAIRAARAEREKLRGALDGSNAAFKELDAGLQLKRAERDNVYREGAELRLRADELEGEIKAVYGEGVTDYGECEKRALRELSALKEKKADLAARQDRSRRKLADLESEEKKLAALKEAAEKEAEKLLSQLDGAVAASGLESAERCVTLAEKYGVYPDAQKTLRDYDGEFAAKSARREELSAVQGIGEFTHDRLKEAEARCESAARACEEAASRVAVLRERLDGLNRRLCERAEIEKDLSRCAAERDLIYQLKELTKGNKFMEFIAGEVLCEISSLASSTLLKLTDGRYFLTYKDNNFNVGDNFDCGNLRGVNTLSGGETFLVSLSLALALSETICARSRKSIEFFFLDEGFGTLDSTLVDTVMNALEKLKSSDFTIGIISHVEELKHRVDSKITVMKATESHGSTVRVSC